MLIILIIVSAIIIIAVILFFVARIQYNKAQDKFSQDSDRLNKEINEWLDKAPKWLVIWLPEQNEGKWQSPAAAIKNVSKEDALNICRGRRLGVMGYDLSEDNFIFYPEPFIEEFEKFCGLKRFIDADSLITALDKNEINYIHCEFIIPGSNSIWMKEKYLKVKESRH
jgi:hypothetical protein